MTARSGPLLDERAARILLARVAEPYDPRVQALVAEHGVLDLAGYLLRDGRTPDGTALDRFRPRLEQARTVDDEQICTRFGQFQCQSHAETAKTDDAVRRLCFFLFFKHIVPPNQPMEILPSG